MFLAPSFYLPIPYCETRKPPERLSFFGGTCGSATLVAGACAHILSLYPNLDIETLRDAIIRFGIRIEGYENPAPRINVANVLNAISHGYKVSEPPVHTPVIKVDDPLKSIKTCNPVERGLALTMLIKQEQYGREDIWNHVKDSSPIVRKVAVWGLQKPEDSQERALFWKHLNSENECGVRGFWLYGLLQEAKKEEVDLWAQWATDINWSVRWCVSEYFKKFAEFPDLEKTHDPYLIKEKAALVYEWCSEYKNKVST